MEHNTSHSKSTSKKGMLFIFLIFLLIVIGGSIGAYLYNNQHKKVQSISSQTDKLSSQFQTLTSRLAIAKSATNVSTNGWKSFCDPYQSVFCFKYPANWTLTAGNDPQFKYASATLTNPTKSLTLTYVNPYIKDDFPADFIAYSASSLKVSDNNLTILGGYYVESVDHTPIYAITNTPVSSVKQNENIKVGAAPAFEYNNNSDTAEIAISPTNQVFPTTQQANAWFNSVNGKTALAILKSVYSK